jgi:hemoglobin-like flavoprotein
MITARQRAFVRSSWDLMRPVAVHVADLFYDRLVELDPSLEELFPDDPDTQRPRFMKAVAASVSGLDDIEALRPMLNELGRRHAADGVREGHYVTIGKALIWTFEQSLAEDFTAPVKDAWSALYAQLSSALIQGAQSRPVTPVSASSAAVSPVAVTPVAVTPAAVTPAAVTPAAVTPAAVTPAAVTPAAVPPQVPQSGPQVTTSNREVAKPRGQRQLAVG